MKELMIHVEKAVRPLRITQGQRGAIREELLTHLQGIYDEELERHGDSSAAVQAAIERFGPAEEISRNLRGSLPWYSAALACVPWCARMRTWPESTGRIAWRAWMTGILFWVIVGIPWSCVLVATDRMSGGRAIGLWFLLASYSVVFFVPFVGMFGCIHGVYGQLRSTRRAVLFAVVGCLVQLGIYFLIKLYVKPTLPLGVFVIPFLAPLIVFATARSSGLMKLVRTDTQRGERAGEWEQLSLSGD
ncbi:MAG TPA: PrgI family protein [Planctomycetes bacterium]|nr:PrgI family protein [Planctomycetota bacterium]